MNSQARKVALVTGASSGIGESAVEELLKKGSRCTPWRGAWTG
jgi:NAD(P)-dependent dehydrogenase (short-subunit alcohol dehydrogenase family)